MNIKGDFDFMIGTKIYKNSNEDMENYSSYAQWCNSNNAHIEDKGDYYEIIQNIYESNEMSLDEKIQLLDTTYDENKKELKNYYLEFLINNNEEGMKEITKELEVLKNNYDSELKSLKEGS